MNRLAIAIVLAIVGLRPPSDGVAQQSNNKLPLIGWLRVASPDQPPGKPLIHALAARLKIEGRDYRLDVRVANGRVERMPELARSLISEAPSVIVAFGPDATRAAMDVTSTIPIVAATAFVEEGFVASLAQPRGNLTGVSMLVTEIDPKKLEILKAVLPEAQHVAVMNDLSTNIPGRMPAMKSAADKLGIRLTIVDVKTADDFEPAFLTFQKSGATALLINASTLFATLRNRLGELALQYRLPAVCQWRSMVEAGCLASYGFPLDELFELVAEQVAKVLDGARPEALPIVQPRRFELVIDLKVARQLGVTIPPAALIRADEVIE